MGSPTMSFHEEAYIQCFDGSSFLTPTYNPFLDPGTMSILGTTCCSNAACQSCSPCLAKILLPTVSGISEEVLLQCFGGCNLDAGL